MVFVLMMSLDRDTGSCFGIECNVAYMGLASVLFKSIAHLDWWAVYMERHCWVCVACVLHSVEPYGV